MSKYTDEQIIEFAEGLMGQGGMLDKEEMNMFNNMTEDQSEIFDNIVFDCEQCGWWTAADELNQTENGQICQECLEENEDE
jgi:hypothetical protein